MSTVEKFLMGALGLIALFLVVDAPNSSKVFQSIGSTTSGLFGTLQGRSVTYKDGSVSVTGGDLAGSATGY